MQTTEQLIAQAQEAGRIIAADAIADGHPESPALYLEFWLDVNEDVADAIGMLAAEDIARVEAAFLAAAATEHVAGFMERLRA